MKKLIAAAAVLCLVGGYLAVPAEAQGRFWVLVNGGLRYIGGQVQVSDGVSGAPALAFASEPTLGFWRSAAGAVRLQGSFTTTSTLNTFSSLTIGASSSRIASGSDGNFAVETTAATFGSTLKVDALPTIASGFGTSPSIGAGSTPLAGSVGVGTGGTATTGTINFNGTAFPTAPFCVATNILTNVPVRTLTTTTQLTFSVTTAWTASDGIYYICISSK